MTSTQAAERQAAHECLQKELIEALEQAHMALIGYPPTHRNAITDAAIEKARAVLARAKEQQ